PGVNVSANEQTLLAIRNLWCYDKIIAYLIEIPLEREGQHRMYPQPSILQPKKAINIFLCHAYDVYKDKTLIDELDKHLSSLERQGQIMIWSVRKVSAGKELLREIDNYLNSADIILLLVSVGFMSSDDSYRVQMQ